MFVGRIDGILFEIFAPRKRDGKGFLKEDDIKKAGTERRVNVSMFSPLTDRPHGN